MEKLKLEKDQLQQNEQDNVSIRKIEAVNLEVENTHLEKNDGVKAEEFFEINHGWLVKTCYNITVI